MVQAIHLALAALFLIPLSASVAISDAQAQEENIGTSEGEVRKIDKSTKKITVRHGPVAGLDMEPMTMVLQVQDAAALDQLKVGDKIRFTVRRGGGAFTLQSFEQLK
jgi:Cu(I)/Ag(I) efflux system periplasmic protein CusF